jgi:hypothetical protein
MSSYWVVAWEEGHMRHQAEAPTEVAAERKALDLTVGQGIKRVTYYEIGD